MRYTIIDLQCEDILWFGLDINGNILAFTSGGSGNVPEFVCRSKEETELLIDFFNNYDAFSTGAELLIEEDGSPLSTDALNFAQHGITCFDVDYDSDDYSYVKIASPDKTITLNDLPDNIKKIISDHLIEVDALQVNKINVPHAFT